MYEEIEKKQVEVQCPICGDVYRRSVKVYQKTVTCHTCKTNLWINKVWKPSELLINHKPIKFIARQVAGGKREFEEMFHDSKAGEYEYIH
ncbi:hypothetical protein [Periweissella ghanensis]|uniref:Uncharacterized protein n=1 Tax=Periweissella ghanensis TaxID=467997 RepID=A0ABN8BR21_9LACO|nr:hypothetical protein [Periweissella ghanensis]MCM0600339.1 hypothetical protein [Periweissella ghanensis]CAH0419255.1 hypothetical protein WGH24286_01702 [Periweissella ghanensis]